MNAPKQKPEWSPVLSNESAANFLRERAEEITKHGGSVRLAFSVQYQDCEALRCKRAARMGEK